MTDPEQVRSVVTQAWTDVLEVNDPSDQDDFFMRGGDSVFAVALIARIEEELAIRIIPTTLFLDGTLGGLITACVDAVSDRTH